MSLISPMVTAHGGGHAALRRTPGFVHQLLLMGSGIHVRFVFGLPSRFELTIVPRVSTDALPSDTNFMTVLRLGE